MVTILDCTIRDGSYAINNNWTGEEVQALTHGLVKCGLSYIEVGSGIGLGAHRKQINSVCTDEQYVRFAAEVKGTAKIGAFFIPGIGTKDDLKFFKTWGGDFIRIGTDVSRSDIAKEYIELARNLGLEVGFNFMKSYAVSPFELCKRATRIEEYGAQMISLVDSAGGMLPKEVGLYMSLLRECTHVRLGFHGHNNLLLANANSIAAIENGVDIIDTTLMGMGRGAGNAQTETMVVILKKMGHNLNIDPLKVADLSRAHIIPKSQTLKGVDDVQLLMGEAQFHDAFLDVITEIADQYDVDYRTLIQEVSLINKENPSKELMMHIAHNLQNNNVMPVFQPKFYHKEIK